MNSRAKAEAELVVPASATELASDLYRESPNSYVGYRYDPWQWMLHRQSVITPRELDELKVGERIINPAHVKELRNAFTPERARDRVRKAKRKKWLNNVLLPLGIMGSSMGLLAYGVSNPGLLGDESPLEMMILLVLIVAGVLSFGHSIISAVQSYKEWLDESDITNLPWLSVEAFKRTNGDFYEFNDPSYEEIYQAVKLIKEVRLEVEFIEYVNNQIKNLRERMSTLKVIREQKASQKRIEESEEKIQRLEDDIAKLLASYSRKSEEKEGNNE